MYKLLKIENRQAIILGIVVGVLAVIPLGRASASSLSTTTLTTPGHNASGANNDIHKAQARSVSADGRYIVFSSQATNLVNSSHNAFEQVYSYDRITKKTELVSRDFETGGPGSGGSYVPSISADGRFVAYASTARNVAPGLNDFCAGWPDPCTNIFVHDLITEFTRIINVDSNDNRLPAIHTGLGGQAPIVTRDSRYVTFLSYPPDQPANTDVYYMNVRDVESQTTRVVGLTDVNGPVAAWDATINDTGRFIAFSSDAKLTVNDFNGKSDVHLYDLFDNRITLVSNSIHNFAANNGSFEPVVSTDGNFVVYESAADNLTANDRNRKNDVFFYDRRKATNTLVSKSTKGTPGLDNSFAADISGDGQYVVYASYAPNLVHADTTDVDVFLYYTQFGATRLLSRALHNGVPANDHSRSPSISQNGKAVTFLSSAHNLTTDPITPSTKFFNLFMALDPYRHIPYYDQTDLLDLLHGD